MVLISPEFLRLLGVLISVKYMFSKWTNITIHLMFVFAIYILKWISIWFFFFCFKFRRIDFEIGLTILCHFPIMFEFMWTVIFLAFGAIYIIYIHSILPLPTTFTLRNIRVHVGSSYSNNILIYIKTSINKIFGFCTILKIPNINLNYSHIWFRRWFNNIRLEY